MSRITLRAAFLGIAAALAVSTAGARQFQSSDVLPADAPTVEAMKHIGELLHQRTGGRLAVSVQHSDQDSENFTVGKVRTGLADMARVNLSVLTSVPSAIVPTLPYLFRSTEHMRHVLDGPIGDQILADMEAEGFIGLCFYDLGARSYYSNKGPLRRIEDVKGLKLRVQAPGTWADLVSAMGGTPVPIPFDKVAAALKAGVIDGSESNWPTYVATGHHLVARYFSRTEHSMMPGVLIFSRRIWTELSPSDQAVIRAAAKDSVAFMRSKLDAYEVSARLKAENSGSIVIDDVDRRSFARALLPLYPKVLQNPRVQQMVRDIEADVESRSVP